MAAQTMLTVPLERVAGILMADGWHVVETGTCRTGLGMLGDVPPDPGHASQYVAFREGGRDVFAPVGAALAFRL